ncbi:MAG: hypothetical protein ACKOUS_04340 [Alphaproteobacteria bacterium]
MRKTDAAAPRSSAARHFAAKRAGFLLREHRRQQTTPDDAQPATTVAVGGDAPAAAAPVAVSEAPVVAGIPLEEVERRVTEAEARGLTLFAALDAAGRAVAEAHGDLERRWVVPLAQASLHIGSELARQTLMDAAGLQRYLDTVTAALRTDNAEPGAAAAPALIEVRLNPEDLAVLERASVQPSAIKLVADPLVPRSGAIASSDDKVVDDRFENRVRFAKEAVLATAADLMREAPS